MQEDYNKKDEFSAFINKCIWLHRSFDNNYNDDGKWSWLADTETTKKNYYKSKPMKSNDDDSRESA